MIETDSKTRLSTNGVEDIIIVILLHKYAVHVNSAAINEKLRPLT